MKKLKIIALLFTCFVLAVMFIACGEEKPKTPDAATETDLREADPNAPDIPGYAENGALDMKEKVFTILINSAREDGNLNSNILIDEPTEDGDPILEASYYRKIAVEQKYDCTLKPVYSGSIDMYLTSILANDRAYDMAQLSCSDFTRLLSGNYLAELTDIPDLDIDRPYWNKGFYDAMAILNRHYAFDGDISVQSLQCVWIMAFNKSLIADHGLDSPFDLVKSGDWTYDKWHEMGKAVADDLNGDGKMTLADDLWGINYNGNTIMGVINSAGVRFAELDGDGIPVLNVGSEVYLSKLTKIYETMRDISYSIDTLFHPSQPHTYKDVEIFNEGRALFVATATNNVTGFEGINLRSSDIDFGIVPYPKWDLTATEYVPYTAGVFHPVYTIPGTNGDLENTGIILEAMAYEGMKTMRQEYFESLLKRKTARDEESSEMIDYIFGNLQYDIGYMINFGPEGKTIAGILGYNMSNDQRAVIVSQIEKYKGGWQRSIDAIVAEIDKN